MDTINLESADQLRSFLIDNSFSNCIALSCSSREIHRLFDEKGDHELLQRNAYVEAPLCVLPPKGVEGALLRVGWSDYCFLFDCPTNSIFDDVIRQLRAHLDNMGYPYKWSARSIEFQGDSDLILQLNDLIESSNS